MEVYCYFLGLFNLVTLNSQYIYVVPQGLGEEELKKSIETLQKMANSLSADMTVLRERDGVEGKVAEVLVRR